MKIGFCALTVIAVVVGFGTTALADHPTDSEKLQVHIQKICPISAMEPGKMGQPVKTEIEGETMFVCCRQCAGKPPKEDHLKTIHAHLAKAQGKCPVMQEELPEDAESIVVEGRQIFVCGARCTKTIEKEPQQYLVVDAWYAEPLKKGKH